MENLAHQEHQPATEQELVSGPDVEMSFIEPSSIHSELSRTGSISLQDSWKIQRAESELRKCLGKNSTETLLKSYSCAWQKDILVQGRMYVTTSWFCFYSNILGWETKTSIKFTDVTSISKQRTALVFPNAILIEVGPKKYGFSSVVHRDKVYHVLIAVWKNALSSTPLTESALLSEVNNWKHSIKDLPNTMVSSSFTADDSESDNETHSHHTLPTSTHEDSFDSDSLLDLEHIDIGFLPGRMSRSSASSTSSTGNTDSASSRSSDCSVTDGHIDDVPLAHPSDEGEKTYPTNGQLHWFKHDVSIGRFNHKLQTLRQVPVMKQCSSTLLINILLVVFIIALLVSTLTMFCRLSHVEPTLQPYLILQPWCRWCSTPTDQLSSLSPTHLH